MNITKSTRLKRASCLLFFTLCLLGMAQGASAADINAASCSSSDVSRAINSAGKNDRVIIPPGTCSWTTTVGFSKGITLQGSGIGNTIIKDAIPGPNPTPLINWACVAGLAHRLTGIEFQNGGRVPHDTNVIRIDCTNVNNTTLRVDHNKFDHINGNDIRTDNAVGVIDHNTFLDSNAGKFTLEIFDTSWNGIGAFGDNSWNSPATWGSGSDFLFVEDNTFDFDPGEHASCTDGYRGARVVYRFNTVKNCEFAWHGTESTGRARSGRAAEVYKNVFDDTTSGGTNMMFQNRDGAALIWGNTALNMKLPRVATFFNYRAIAYFTPYGPADGTSPWDVNDAANPFYSGTVSSGGNNGLTVAVAKENWKPDQWAGYVIRKLSCTNAKRTQTCYSPIVSNTSNTITFVGTMGLAPPPAFAPGDKFEINRVLETMDQPGRGGGTLVTGTEDEPSRPNDWKQIDFPSYQWLNTNNGASIAFVVNPSCSNTCRANKHYYDYVGNFNGTAGVGSGPIANRPATCSAGVVFWATDEGEWWADHPGADGRAYKCISKDEWSLFYTPYIYPHPLAAGK